MEVGGRGHSHLVYEFLVVRLLDERDDPSGRLGRAAVVLASQMVSSRCDREEAMGERDLACQNLRT